MNNRIKIAYLITGLQKGGAEMVVRDLVFGIDKDKFDPLVISVLPPGVVGEEILIRGIPVFGLNMTSWNFPVVFMRLFRLLRNKRPDILHTHLFHADILGRIVGWCARVPFIVSTVHNINIGGRVREFFIRITKWLSHYDIAVSGIVLNNALKKKLTREDHSCVVYNGIDIEEFKNGDRTSFRESLGIDADTLIAVSVGNLTKQKGYEYLFQAIQKIKFPMHFYILGEGNERKRLEELIEVLQLKGKVFLQGAVQNVREYLIASDVFIMPSLWEGFSIALLEAAATGTLIVATDVGGNAEVIHDGENGFLIPPKNSDAIAEKISLMMTLPESERERICHNAHMIAEEKFTRQIMVDGHERLYCDLVETTI